MTWFKKIFHQNRRRLGSSFLLLTLATSAPALKAKPPQDPKQTLSVDVSKNCSFEEASAKFVQDMKGCFQLMEGKHGALIFQLVNQKNDKRWMPLKVEWELYDAFNFSIKASLIGQIEVFSCHAVQGWVEIEMLSQVLLAANLKKEIQELQATSQSESDHEKKHAALKCILLKLALAFEQFHDLNKIGGAHYQNFKKTWVKLLEHAAFSLRPEVFKDGLHGPNFTPFISETIQSFFKILDETSSPGFIEKIKKNLFFESQPHGISSLSFSYLDAKKIDGLTKESEVSLHFYLTHGEALKKLQKEAGMDTLFKEIDHAKFLFNLEAKEEKNGEKNAHFALYATAL